MPISTIIIYDPIDYIIFSYYRIKDVARKLFLKEIKITGLELWSGT